MNRKERRHDREIFRLAIPALAALAADPLYSLIDTAFVGHLGVSQLAALAIGTAAFTASFWIFSFLAFGVTPRVARAFGAGDRPGADTTGVQALFLAVVLGAAVTVIGVVFAGPIVRAFGASDNVAVYAEPYLRIRALAAIPVLIGQVGQGWMRGMQDTRTPMFVLGAGLLVNTLLNYVLIYPADLGVEGSALATVIGQGGVAVAFVILLRRRMTFARWVPDLAVIRGLIRVGLDLVVRTGALLAAMTVATAVAARMGEVTLAAWQIAMQVFLLLAFTLDSLAIAAQAMVGRFLGAVNTAEAVSVGRRLMRMGVILGVLLFVVLGVSSRWVARLFTDDGRVITLAGSLLLWVAIVQPLSAVAFTLDGILIGASDTRFLAAAMVASSLVYVAISLLSLERGWGVEGLTIAATSWLMVRSLTTGTRFIRGRWALQT
ncbi:MAG TPA: MATE family efflux transporter [Actinomycetota bacterium]|nr:MATE family efflux transporter [Actinomycetota bacterium]